MCFVELDARTSQLCVEAYWSNLVILGLLPRKREKKSSPSKWLYGERQMRRAAFSRRWRRKRHKSRRNVQNWQRQRSCMGAIVKSGWRRYMQLSHARTRRGASQIQLGLFWESLIWYHLNLLTFDAWCPLFKRCSQIKLDETLGTFFVAGDSCVQLCETIMLFGSVYHVNTWSENII